MKLKYCIIFLLACIFFGCKHWLEKGNPSFPVKVVNNSAQDIYVIGMAHGMYSPAGFYWNLSLSTNQIKPHKEMDCSFMLDIDSKVDWHSVFYDQVAHFDTIFIALLEQPASPKTNEHIPTELGVLKIDTITAYNVNLSAKSYTIYYP